MSAPLKQKYETEQSKGASTCKNFLWWNVFSDMWCIEQVHMLAHKTTHVSWFSEETFALRAAQQRRRKLAADCSSGATGVVFDTLHLTARWPDEGKTCRYGSRPWGLADELWWELRLQKESLSIFVAGIWLCGFFSPDKYHKAVEVWRSNRLLAEQVHANVGNESVGEADRFKYAQMLVFYHPPSLLCALLLFPSLPPFLLSCGEESSADCSSGLSPLYEQCFCGWKPS